MNQRATIADVCDAASALNEGARLLLDDLDHEGVHRLRVLCKRLRAAWRWIGWELDYGPAKAQQARIRDLGRLFSGNRDAVVLHELERSFNAAANQPNDAAEVPHSGDPELAVLETNPEDLAKASRILSDDGKAWQQLRQQHGGKSIGEQALLKAYKRAVREGRQAVAGNDSRAWHDWRKNVKTLLYQIELLFGKKPNTGKGWIKGVRRLAETLGDYHDLALFSQALQQSKRHGRQTVQQKVEERAGELGRDAGRLYNKLFDKRPKQAVKRFRSRR